VSVTIKDIAKRANVSSATVSRHINENGYVSSDARRRIEAVIKELDYRPNWTARSLRRGRTHTIGLIIPSILNVYYTAVAASILEHFHKHGYHVMIQISDEDARKELELFRVLQDRKVDGIIYAPAANGDNSEHVRVLAEAGMPLLELNRQRLPDLLDAVLADNFRGGYIATEHLIRLGHRRIALISGGTHLTTARERLSGYRQALDDYGVRFEPDLVRAKHFSKSWGSQATEALLGSCPWPTAIFAGSNRVLMGTMHTLAAHHVRVPDDISIVSFDDSDWLSFWQPPITTVDVAIDEMGAKAVDVMLKRIEEGVPATKPQAHRLAVSLIERRSCGQVRLPL
jgi:LacI family transcriptional regulator